MYWISVLMIVSFFLGAQSSFAAESATQNTRLRDKYTELSKQLNNNQFKRPLHMSSMESSDNLKGEIFAVVSYPFATVNKALTNPENWCDLLILHINVKYCHAANKQEKTVLSVYIGKKD